MLTIQGAPGLFSHLNEHLMMEGVVHHSALGIVVKQAQRGEHEQLIRRVGGVEQHPLRRVHAEGAFAREPPVTRHPPE